MPALGRVVRNSLWEWKMIFYLLGRVSMAQLRNARFEGRNVDLKNETTPRRRKPDVEINDGSIALQTPMGRKDLALIAASGE